MSVTIYNVHAHIYTAWYEFEHSLGIAVIAVLYVDLHISLQTSEAWKVVLVSSTARRKWKVGTRNHLQSHSLYSSLMGAIPNVCHWTDREWAVALLVQNPPSLTTADSFWDRLVYISFNIPFLCFTCEILIFFFFTLTKPFLYFHAVYYSWNFVA